MVRHLALVLALLLAGPAFATPPPPTPPEILAEASDWFVGHWTHEGPVEPPDHGPGHAQVAMVVRADRTLELTGAFTPDGAASPTETFRMTATWWIEVADTLGLRVRLEDVMVSEDGAPPQPGGLVIEVMNLEVRPDGTLYDSDDGVSWHRREP